MLATSHSRIIAVLLAAVVLIGGANLAAYAANGKPLLLGKNNTATKKTTVKNTGSGPALRLKTKPGQPPLKVNRTTKVNKLNADRVDGKHASDLETRAYRYQMTSTAASGSHTISFPGLAPGTYLMNYSIVSRNGGSVYCIAVSSRQALSYSSDIGAAYDTNVGSAIIDTGEGEETLSCNGGPALELYSNPVDSISEVTFLRLDQVTTNATTVTRPQTPRGGGAATSRR
ncbi:hypothetical protein GCM10027020_22660 [Nocardioides salsibiostraticola]